MRHIAGFMWSIQQKSIPRKFNYLREETKCEPLKKEIKGIEKCCWWNKIMTAEVYELRESFAVQANFQRLK